jgi:hypothetical protein
MLRLQLAANWDIWEFAANLGVNYDCYLRLMLRERRFPSLKILTRLEALEKLYAEQIQAIDDGSIVCDSTGYRYDFTVEGWLGGGRSVRPADLQAVGAVGADLESRENPLNDDFKSLRRAPRVVYTPVRRRSRHHHDQAEPHRHAAGEAGG